MTLTVCWSAKGGSGTTVVAACLGLEPLRRSVLIDLDGELPCALGTSDHGGQGLSDWFVSDRPASAVADLAIDVDDTTRLVPRGPASLPRESPRWDELGRWLAASDVEFIVDAGFGEVPRGLLADTGEPAGSSGRAPDRVRSLLVTRRCYLALERARGMTTRSDGVIVIDEPGRRLSIADVERSAGAPVVARVPLDPALARAVDCGLLAGRLPTAVRRALSRAT